MPRPPLLSNIICYHCGSSQTSKAGFARGKQRYYCRACRRSSRENPALQGGKKRRSWRSKSLPLKNKLILELLAIAQRIGKTPTTDNINKLSKTGKAHFLYIYYQVFGSFLEAVRKAGLKSHYNQTYDKDSLLDELRALREILKRPLLGKDVVAARKKQRISPPYHFQRAFGSIPKAIEAADAGRKIYTREEMRKILRQIDFKLKRPVIASDVDSLFRAGAGPSLNAIEREFGGMAKARRAANIKNVFQKASHPVEHWQKYTVEELIEQLKSLGRMIGRRPTYRDITRGSNEGLCAAAATFVRMFGSLLEAYRKAGFTPVKPRFYTDKEIISTIEKLAKEMGRMPTRQELNAASKAGKSPSPGTITQRIGTLTELKSRFSSITSQK
jgi:hypothetical protein